MKLSISTILNGNTLSMINSNFQKIAQELQERVLYRKNPTGEPNTVQNDIDMDGNDIINVDKLQARVITLDGVNLNNTLSGGTFDYSEDAAESAAEAAASALAANGSAIAANASAVAAAAAALTNSRITITQYGASTGATAAVNDAAIAAALAANPGAKIYVPKGTYTVSNGEFGAVGAILEFDKGANFTSAGGNGATQFAGGSAMIGYSEGADKDTWYWGKRLVGSHATGVGSVNAGFSPTSYMFDTRTNDADTGADFHITLTGRNIFGGPNMKGGRIGVFGTAEQQQGASSPSSANRNYVGVQGVAYAQGYAGQGGDGGTFGNEKGAYFGLAGGVYVNSLAQYVLDATGGEYNTFIGNNVVGLKYSSGITVVGCNASSGTAVDCAIRVSFQPPLDGVYTGGVPWRHGITFTDSNGADPIFPGGDLINSYWQNGIARQLSRGFDLTGFNITGEVIASGLYMKLYNDHLYLADNAGFSVIEPNGPSANSNLLIRGRGTGLVGFGNKTATSDTVVTGYITVCDLAGNAVRIATVS